jgi:hypothetical protein
MNWVSRLGNLRFLPCLAAAFELDIEMHCYHYADHNDARAALASCEQSFGYATAASQGFIHEDPARCAVLHSARRVSACPLRSGRRSWAAAAVSPCAIRAFFQNWMHSNEDGMNTRYFASCTISCEVNIHSPSSQHHYCLPPLPPSILTQVITTHSRLYRRARICGGSVSGSYPPGVAVAPVAGPLQAQRRCRRASTSTAGGPACRGSVAGPGPVAAPSLGPY